MSNTKYNPANKGKPFNYEPPQVLNDVTDEQRAKAQNRTKKIIESARKKLGS